ncbi:uncharacterized protein I206_104528 [Kwoniella pini CBS 10737]|uniref:WLM domain-containing protein n=1 Tax=Kwoniella pini CBS 10737 TaxID=1296096 RepID=A0A1B9I775_9TREE|nr:uncharacterized protein I206_02060 [Kwoniella pini CBS 10737]OCF51346.1 hypothetical protein I206_02060 [Kwoniella pini CBS 10737]
MVDPISFISRFEHLPNRIKSDEARPLLEKIASQVKPIMKKRGWKVGTLAEFLPSNPSLLGLNINSGQKINLRLRPPGNENTFYEFDQLILVMLHELTHNVHGPHDAKFYKLLEELEEEYYELKRKGFSGEGFHSEGNKLSGLKLNEYEGKAKGLAAAEKRLQQQRMIGRGGVLGGSRNTSGKSMKELIAEAAERRLRDDKTCAVGHGIEAENESNKAHKESIGVDAIDLVKADELKKENSASDIVEHRDKTLDQDGIIDLTEDSDEDIKDSKPSVQSTNQSIPPITCEINETRESIPNTEISPSNSTPNQTVNQTRQIPIKIEINQKNKWTCQSCTLINSSKAQTCEACLTPKPSDIEREGIKTDQGWYCGFCSSGPHDMERWSCMMCGQVRRWG